MLFSPERHEPLRADAWDEARAREAIEAIVRDTEARFTPEGLWPMHPGDASNPDPQYLLYWGASGVIWALHHLRDRAANRAAMGRPADAGFAAYLMGDTGIRLLEHRLQPSAAIADELARLCGGHLDDPTLELMWGTPGTLLAALFMHERTGELLLAAGETTWQAGPLNKGANLCHGTGGNGYAFLKLHRRFGDEAWLDRARAFAMHGIAQTEADLAAHGHRRYSLWTGDPGFAIYLWDCIEGTDRFPTLDCFF
ncbi:lanthionine synthetase LanC family protein [Variovorax sp. UC122_21]|uniref:lanthionine synthetase LanC family protein n=1 Tax=Variovorax sp. UC122_21 TaxID=3374554 RepID=UPI0037571B40